MRVEGPRVVGSLRVADRLAVPEGMGGPEVFRVVDGLRVPESLRLAETPEVIESFGVESLRFQDGYINVRHTCRKHDIAVEIANDPILTH